jgi:hypothetical protein
VVAVDHVVVLSPDLDRTAAVLRAAGFDQRRLREGPTPGGSTRQAFFRMSEVILEVVQAPAGTKVAGDPAVRRDSGASPSWSTTWTRPRPPWATCWASRATRSSPAGASRPCAPRPAWARPWRS